MSINLHGHTGRCGTDRDACMLAYAAAGDILRGADWEYRVAGNPRVVTEWVYAHADDGLDRHGRVVRPAWLILAHGGTIALTAAGEKRAAENAADAGVEAPARMPAIPMPQFQAA